MRITFLRIFLLALIACALPSHAAERGKKAKAEPAEPQPVHEVVFQRDGVERTVSGRVLREFADAVYLQADDGALYTIRSSELQTRVKTDETFRPATHDEIAERLLAEMPSGFRIHKTEHYVVCYGTSRTYAKWTSSLLERLHRAFTNYWARKGFDLHEPEFPLIALVFPEREQYHKSAKEQGTQIASGVVGFYSLTSNRINTYDLTGMEALRGPRNRRGSLKEINQMLSTRLAVPLVSTIVHEATHQIAFNCGLQTRLSDIPLWLVEGMAVVFEAPDLSSSRGWRGIGNINYMRLDTFRENLPQWRTAKLISLLSNDKLLRDPRTAADAYADVWAINYYLIRYRSKDYIAYLQTMSKKPSLKPTDSVTRLEEFREHFGDIHEFERDFLKQMSRLE